MFLLFNCKGVSPNIGRLSQNIEATSLFLNQPTMLRVIPPNGSVCGITVLMEELFVTRGKQVDVYNNSSFILSRQLAIPDAKYLSAIVACTRNSCLYVSDTGRKIIYRYDARSNNVTAQWSVSVGCELLSLTKTYNLLVTSSKSKQIREYSPDGSLISEIRMHPSMDGLQHCVQLSDDRFVVSHQGTMLCRVCIVDGSGCIVQSYGGLNESDIGRMSGPCQVAVDKHDRVIVADCNKDRVELLSPTLTHLEYIQIPGVTLNGPHALHLDELNRRLYVGEYWGARVFVLSY